MIETLLISVVFLLAFYFVGAPLLSREDIPEDEDLLLRDLKIRKEVMLSEIKDLELDFALKKISKEDFKSLYDETVAEGVGLLKQMDQKP